MESMVLDCTTAPNDPRCRGQKGMVLSETYIMPPTKRTFLQLSIHGAYNHGFVSGANIFAGGMDIGVALAHGLDGPLPGAQGGWYSAFVAESLAGVYGGALVTTGNPTQGAGFFSVRPFIRAGVEFDHFGAFDSEDRTQSVVGVNVMYAVGGDWEYLAGDFSGSQLFFGHGPSVALMLGRYLPLKTRLERGYLRLGLWNVPAAGVNFLQIGGGASFP